MTGHWCNDAGAWCHPSVTIELMSLMTTTTKYVKSRSVMTCCRSSCLYCTSHAAQNGSLSVSSDHCDSNIVFSNVDGSIKPSKRT